jgi:hypothetical protein
VAAFTEVPTFIHIDPYEIQCWPPQEVDEAMTRIGVEYPYLLDAIAGLLVSRSPRFAQDLCPFLASYMHDHNFTQPLSPVEEAGLRAMIENPEIIDVKEFQRLVPLVIQKATTLATETFVQKRPSWVLKALPHLGVIQSIAGSAGPAVPASPFD